LSSTFRSLPFFRLNAAVSRFPRVPPSVRILQPSCFSLAAFSIQCRYRALLRSLRRHFTTPVESYSARLLGFSRLKPLLALSLVKAPHVFFVIPSRLFSFGQFPFRSLPFGLLESFVAFVYSPSQTGTLDALFLNPLSAPLSLHVVLVGKDGLPAF